LTRAGVGGADTLPPVPPQPQLTPPLEHAICDLVRIGVPLSRAARELGIRASTARTWLWFAGRPGTADADPYRRFAEAIADAKREHEFAVQQLLVDLRPRLNGHRHSGRAPFGFPPCRR
jgi:hypothetical protein